MFKRFLFIFFVLFSFCFSFNLAFAAECSFTKGCYRVDALITGPDCSCPWMEGGDNSNCELGDCPQVIDCQWGDWGECNLNCGGGTQTRIKIPAQGGGQDCVGELLQACNTEPCPWRRYECDTSIGEYICTQVETIGQNTYETKEKCREDEDNECKKNVIFPEYYKKIIGDCWQLTSYDWSGLSYQVTMGYVNDDNYLDLIEIDSSCNL